ncbi:MAG: hypothetical protein JEZ09_18510, partial [Salinivirgaceae bacterium]|nr:hypothetical protein [Salinivirgaceae bacterium]
MMDDSFMIDTLLLNLIRYKLMEKEITGKAIIMNNIISKRSLVYVFKNVELMVKAEGENFTYKIPDFEDIQHINCDFKKAQFVGKFNGKECYALQVYDDLAVNGELSFQTFRSLYSVRKKTQHFFNFHCFLNKLATIEYG